MMLHQNFYVGSSSSQLLMVPSGIDDPQAQIYAPGKVSHSAANSELITPQKMNEKRASATDEYQTVT